LYIAHIHSEVIDRPLYIARRDVKLRTPQVDEASKA
jgi:hypothetical protein